MNSFEQSRVCLAIQTSKTKKGSNMEEDSKNQKFADLARCFPQTARNGLTQRIVVLLYFVMLDENLN